MGWPSRFRIKERGRIGWMDGDGNVVIRPQYRYAGEFSEGLAAVSRASEERANEFIDIEGEGVFSVREYGYCWGFQSGRAQVRRRGEDYSYGFLNRRGELVIETQFDEAYWFSEGLAAVRRDGLWGFVDHEGRLAIGRRFARVGPFREGLAQAKLTESGLYGFIGRDGAFAIAPQFPAAGGFGEQRANVWFQAYNTPPTGLIDPAGEVVYRGAYRALQRPIEGRVVCDAADSKRGAGPRAGYLDRDGREVTRLAFESCMACSEGLARVRLPGEWKSFYVDKDGQVVLGPYWSAEDFRDGLAEVRTGTWRGYINTEGNWVWWRRVRGSL